MALIRLRKKQRQPRVSPGDVLLLSLTLIVAVTMTPVPTTGAGPGDMPAGEDLHRSLFMDDRILLRGLSDELPLCRNVPFCLDRHPDDHPGEERSGRKFVILTSYADNDTARSLVQKKLLYFTTKKRKTFAKWLERSGRFIDTIQEILREEGLPEDLVYLPLIESGYSTRARSRAQAVGPWQFIRGTARRYGMTVDYWVDERHDPIKSTRAAARYLKDLYGEFGCWQLALAAYNAGEGKVKRALRKTKQTDYWRIIRTRYLKRETRNYVAKFIAAGTIASNPERYGFTDIEYHPPLTFEEVTITGPASLSFVAKCSETSVGVIRELNPELKRWSTPPDRKEYVIRVPEGRDATFLECLESAPARERMPRIPYIIRKGDTLYDIAAKYQIPRRELYAMNKGINPRRLRPGSLIYLPPEGGHPERASRLTLGLESTISYIIQKGDTLYDIAQKYRISTKELVALNREVDPRRLQPGSVIYLPFRH